MFSFCQVQLIQFYSEEISGTKPGLDNDRSGTDQAFRGFPVGELLPKWMYCCLPESEFIRLVRFPPEPPGFGGLPFDDGFLQKAGYACQFRTADSGPYFQDRSTWSERIAGRNSDRFLLRRRYLCKLRFSVFLCFNRYRLFFLFDGEKMIS